MGLNNYPTSEDVVVKLTDDLATILEGDATHEIERVGNTTITQDGSKIFVDFNSETEDLEGIEIDISIPSITISSGNNSGNSQEPEAPAPEPENPDNNNEDPIDDTENNDNPDLNESNDEP